MCVCDCVCVCVGGGVAVGNGDVVFLQLAYAHLLACPSTFSPLPCMQLFCYASFALLGVWATYNQPWLTDTKQLWAGWPHHTMT